MLNNLKWKTLETRRFHTKATLIYKILNDLSAPQLSNSLVKLNDTNINYNLRNMETDLALPRPCTNFLKCSFKYSGYFKCIDIYTYCTVNVILVTLNAFDICTYHYCYVFTYAPPGNQLLLCVASVVK